MVLSDGVQPEARVLPGGRNDELFTLSRTTNALGMVVAPLTGDLSAPQVKPFAGCGDPEGGVKGAASLSWCGQRGAIAVVNGSAVPRRVVIRFGVRTAGPERARVTITAPVRRRTVRVGDVPRPVEVAVDLPSLGAQVITLRTNGERIEAPGDPRELYMAITGLALSPG
jgi:hypothetical protein